MKTILQRFFTYGILVLVISVFVQSTAILGIKLYSPATGESYAAQKSFSNEFILALEDINTSQPTPSQVIKRVAMKAVNNMNKSRASEVIPPFHLSILSNVDNEAKSDSGSDEEEKNAVFMEIEDIIRNVQNTRKRKNISSSDEIKASTGKKTGGIFHEVKKGDTLSSIAERYGVAVNQIKELNSIRGDSLPKPGTKLLISPQENFYYSVAPGETLWTIASKFQVKVSDLIELNKLKIDSVVPGQKILIPSLKPPAEEHKPQSFACEEPKKSQVVDITRSRAGEEIARHAEEILKKSVEPLATDTGVIAPGGRIFRQNNSFRSSIFFVENDNSLELELDEDDENEETSEVELTGGDSIINPQESLRQALREENLSRTRIIFKKSKVDKPRTDQANGLKFSWPVRGKLTSPFGMRIHPIREVVAFHEGIDISGAVGTPVKAAADGLVTFAGVKGGYGNVIYVKHIGGYQTRYAHCSRLLVEKGEKVRRGQVIGYIGLTGVTTGPHLHFEIRTHGRAKDPVKLLRRG